MLWERQSITINKYVWVHRIWQYFFLEIDKGSCKKRRIAMNRKKTDKIDLKNLDEAEKMKYEVAEELGLLDQVLEEGWKSLSSKETGRIGGLVARRKREHLE